MKPINGKVKNRVAHRGADEIDVTIAIPITGKADGLTVGATVQVTRVLTDEELGKRFRAIVQAGPPTLTPRAIRDLADTIRDEAGWPILAELVLDAADVERDEGR